MYYVHVSLEYLFSPSVILNRSLTFFLGFSIVATKLRATFPDIEECNKARLGWIFKYFRGKKRNDWGDNKGKGRNERDTCSGMPLCFCLL
jgi:hypothetical protein